MTTIVVPDDLAPLDPLPVTPAAVEGALAAVRGAATTTSDAWSTTSQLGAPRDFEGLSADAAGYAFTVFGRDADDTTAALEAGSTALDVYADQVRHQVPARAHLASEVAGFNFEADVLRAAVQQAGSDADADVAALQDQAARLRTRADDLGRRIAAFWGGVTAAEQRLARALAAADTDQEARALAAAPHPDTSALRRRLVALQGNPSAVYAWWRSLTTAQREALMVSDPGLVGNTDGIPARDRDDANRSQLSREEEYLTSLQRNGQSLTAAQQKQLATITATEKALKEGRQSLDPHTGLPVDTLLLVFDPSAFNSDGKVAVSYGDPDTADDTAVVVPGFTNDGSTIDSQGQDALNLLRAAGSDHSTAVIAWMGYNAPSGTPVPKIDVDANPVGGVGVHVDVPDSWGVTQEADAIDGGHRLSAFVDGLRATHPGDPTHLSVIGHSYGSTTAAHAASDDGLRADSLTLLGSPGAGDHARTVADLHMPAGKVYVGAAENDPVTWLGGDSEVGMGRDPSQQDFGATRIDVDNGTRYTLDHFTDMFKNHSSYFDPTTNPQSVNNLGAIIRGDDPTVVPGRTESARHHFVSYGEDEAPWAAQEALKKAHDLGKSVWDHTGKSAYDHTIGKIPGL